MPELIQVSDDVYYIEHHLNHGVVRVGDGECVVIDTGVDDEAGQMILAALDAVSLRPVAIINTHSHADHYGGNRYIVDQTGCKVYAPPVEAAIMENPSLEPLYIYGAFPPDELRQRSLMGIAVRVDELLDGDAVTIGNKTFGLVPLEGHSPKQTGIMVDDICFCADSVFSTGAWKALVVVYGMDIKRAFRSIERLKALGAKSYIPSHAMPTGDIEPLANFNLTRIRMLADYILHIIETPTEAQEVLYGLCRKYGVAMKTMQQYYLSLDTVKAYLSYLAEEELATYEIDSNRLMWRSTE